MDKEIRELIEESLYIEPRGGFIEEPIIRCPDSLVNALLKMPIEEYVFLMVKLVRKN